MDRNTASFATMNLNRVMLSISLWALLQTHTAYACRYNVRDIGFVDLGTEVYSVYGYVSADTPDEVTSSFKQIAYAALMDTCVKAAIINTDEQRDHPALRYLKALEEESFPAAVLVSPDGRVLEVPVATPDRPFKETLWTALDDIITSPAREKLLEHLATAYCVVLLIEGADPERNASARETVLSAIQNIEAQMQMMPKPILHPPVLTVINRESLPRERVLLWNLGLEASEIDEPYAAVIYGRGRRLGPLVKGENITEPRMTAFLSVIGADCECGLDREWTDGTMLLVRWDSEVQAQVAQGLGFDPENPVVKTEVSQILGHRAGARGAAVKPDSYSSRVLGYEEVVLDFERAAGAERVPTLTIPKPAASQKNASRTAIEASVSTPSAALLRNVICVVMGLFVLVVSTIGVAILLRARGR